MGSKTVRQKPQLLPSHQDKVFPGDSMRACMVSYSVYDGDNRVRRYAETLVRNGFEVDAFAMWRVGHQSLGDVLNGVRVYRLQGRIKNEKTKLTYLWRLLQFFFRSLWVVTKEHWKKPYDLIHVHSVPDFEVFAAIFAKLTGAKVILDIHDMVPEFYASKFGISKDAFVFKALVGIERVSTAFADHVIASNHIWEERLHTRGVAPGKVTAIINYPDLNVFRPQGRTRADGKFIVLYPGSMTYHQGLDIAIRAFAKIHTQVPNAEFHVYGSGDRLESLKRLVAELGLQEKILFKGSLVVEKLVRVMDMELRVRHLRVNFRKRPNRDIQPLVVGHASRVQHDELAVRPRSPLRPENIQVRIVDDRGYLPGRHAAGVQPLFPDVIRSDDVVGKRRGHPGVLNRLTKKARGTGQAPALVGRGARSRYR
jgi:Glycosyl transferase 4-like domain/Glycosyl transferases group 1